MAKSSKDKGGIKDTGAPEKAPAPAGNGHGQADQAEKLLATAAAVNAAKSRLAALQLRRSRPKDDEDEPRAPAAVSAGPVDKVIELAFNPTREKMREMTIIDRMQGHLFPQMDMINTLMRYCVEISMYRMDKVAYRADFKRSRPLSPNAMDEFLFRTAQWQKSVQGKNLERATDIALAETEGKTDDGGMSGGGSDAWAEK